MHCGRAQTGAGQYWAPSAPMTETMDVPAQHLAWGYFVPNYCTCINSRTSPVHPEDGEPAEMGREVCLCFQGTTQLSHGCFPSYDVPVLDYLPWAWEHDGKQILRCSQLEFSCSVITFSVWTSSACQCQAPVCLLARG